MINKFYYFYNCFSSIIYHLCSVFYSTCFHFMTSLLFMHFPLFHIIYALLYLFSRFCPRLYFFRPLILSLLNFLIISLRDIKILHILPFLVLLSKYLFRYIQNPQITICFMTLIPTVTFLVHFCFSIYSVNVFPQSFYFFNCMT